MLKLAGRFLGGQLQHTFTPAQVALQAFRQAVIARRKGPQRRLLIQNLLNKQSKY